MTGTKKSCTCKACVTMCKQYPCLGTPADIQKIIEAGFASKLMLDKWKINSIEILLPALVGYEKKHAPDKKGTCTFLKNDRCQLHPLGLKPTEGKATIHDDNDKGGNKAHHRKIGCTWDTPLGRKLVHVWKCNYLGRIGKK